MKKEYINPSIEVITTDIANIMDISIPIEGTTDDKKPNEAKSINYIDDDLLDDSEIFMQSESILQ